MIQINGTLTLAPGTLADSPATLEAMKTMVTASRAEDGCIAYTFAQDLTDPDSIVIVERWRDGEALAAHGASAHMAEFRKVMAEHPPLSRDLTMYETDDGKPI
ncbi:putative quinol monooxygenase [Altererythrobacter sp. MTPC7]|uniref:putative quinol monooxygenase n=1 Tax=Altererythrobacter sp. MTPC7 TaxID=3056567 RepID=UPI0036F3E40B